MSETRTIQVPKELYEKIEVYAKNKSREKDEKITVDDVAVQLIEVGVKSYDFIIANKRLFGEYAWKA